MTAIPEGAKLTSFLLDGAGGLTPCPAKPFSRRPVATALRFLTCAIKTGLRPDGNCRACVVEVKGERPLAPACCRTPQEGMEVASTSERARLSQKMVLELLLSDVIEPPLYPRLGTGDLGRRAGSRPTALRPAPAAASGRVPPGHCRKSRRLYPVYPLSACLS